MTCIIGFTDRESSVSWIGCDSLGSNNYTKSIESPAKAFRNEQIRNVLMGGTTSFRHLDLLKYAEDLFDGIDVYRKPIIDPESLRPRAHWEDVVQDGPCRWSGKCSACKVRNDIPPVMLAHYCPHCGAKMEDADES